MTTPRTAAIVCAAEWGARLPAKDVDLLSVSARRGPAALHSLAADAASAVVRGACQDLIELLTSGAITRDELSGALSGAAAASSQSRAAVSVDVVWTGPESSVTSTRLTSAVIVELIDQARESLLLISYASQNHPQVAAALGEAVERGVYVVLLLERPADNVSFHQPRSAFADIKALRLVWSQSSRQAGASLHAKILVVDRAASLVGSANITGYALERNLECGLLVRGGYTAGRIWEHVNSLRDLGILTSPGT